MSFPRQPSLEDRWATHQCGDERERRLRTTGYFGDGDVDRDVGMLQDVVDVDDQRAAERGVRLAARAGCFWFACFWGADCHVRPHTGVTGDPLTISLRSHESAGREPRRIMRNRWRKLALTYLPD